MRAIVTEVGQHALDGKEPLIILFGENATEALKEYSVIQKFEAEETLAIKENDQLRIGEKEYTISHVGSFANSNLSSISHVTLVFSEVPKEDPIANGLYLSPFDLPTVEEGTTIEYISHGV
ncbi:PTS glucitol/sorbitol transporter subunit IIA [Enterococcus sp. LJL99]